MKQEIKEKWVEALRSGEYSQTKNTLRDKHGFCCLGVLCDLYRKETGLLEWVDEGRHFVIDGIGNFTTLNSNVMDWAELKDNNPMVWIDNVNITSVAQVNDRGATFSEIADLIEKNL